MPDKIVAWGTIAAVVAALAIDVFAATKEERRAERREREVVYQACAKACFEGCRK